jgi:hypothetical protein
VFLRKCCGNYGANIFAVLKTVPMFASETENDITSDMTRILRPPPISSEQITDLATSNI